MSNCTIRLDLEGQVLGCMPLYKAVLRHACILISLHITAVNAKFLTHMPMFGGTVSCVSVVFLVGEIEPFNIFG